MSWDSRDKPTTNRQQLNEALDQDFDIRKTALHMLIRKIEVDEDGQLDFDFYQNEILD